MELKEMEQSHISATLTQNMTSALPESSVIVDWSFMQFKMTGKSHKSASLAKSMTRPASSAPTDASTTLSFGFMGLKIAGRSRITSFLLNFWLTGTWKEGVTHQQSYSIYSLTRFCRIKAYILFKVIQYLESTYIEGKDFCVTCSSGIN